MKTVCIVCGEEFEGVNSHAKYCPTCRAAGKRICTDCGKLFITPKPSSKCNTCKYARKKAKRAKKIVQRKCVVCERLFDVVGQEKTCPSCREYAQVRKEARAEKPRRPTNKRSLEDKAKAARTLGVSYGKYSAMMRGLLKV